MATLGKHCKAYPLQRFRQFPGWTEATHNARKIFKEIDGETHEVARELAETDYLYLQENFTVTDGIFLDEHVIFSNVSPGWIEFCQNTLAFQSPTGQPSLEADPPSQTPNAN